MPGRILIVDDRMTSRIDLVARLTPAAHVITPCSAPDMALKSARAQMPDLLLISATLPDDGAITLARTIRALPGGASLPVALIGDTSDRTLRLAALKAGIDALLDQPLPAEILLARVRNLLQRGSRDGEMLRNDSAEFGFAEGPAQAFIPPGQITLIAPCVETGMRWRNQLLPLMRDRIDVLNPTRALSELNAASQPDAIVIAADGDDYGSALRLLSELRCRDDTRRAAILLVKDRTDTDLSVMALDLGVDDLIETGFDSVEMALRLRRELARKARNDRCRNVLRDGLRLAVTDPLTGLFNRRYAMSELQKIAAAPKDGDDTFAVMMLDLDRFKRVNDTFGHAAGDAVLTEISARMNGCLRDGDFLARIGGEEFLAVIRNCDSAAAANTAERLRRVVSDRPVALSKGRAVDVTLSIGMVLAPGAMDQLDPAKLMDLADMALFAAKTDGRNQVSLHQTAA